VHTSSIQGLLWYQSITAGSLYPVSTWRVGHHMLLVLQLICTCWDYLVLAVLQQPRVSGWLLHSKEQAGTASVCDLHLWRRPTMPAWSQSFQLCTPFSMAACVDPASCGTPSSWTTISCGYCLRV
jgi:hypothetical protein